MHDIAFLARSLGFKVVVTEKRVKFHLDSLGRFRRIRFKFTQTTTTGSDKIRILAYNVVTYKDEYYSETD